MGLFNFFKRNKNKNDLVDKNGKVIEKSAIEYQGVSRYLKLKDDDCAIVLHEGDNVEVVFTKIYNETQDFTSNEETLMALALFLKQPGFLETILTEFRKIAAENVNVLTNKVK